VKRREFITLLGGAAAAWPVAVRTQPEGVRRIGTLMGYAESESGKPSRGSRASLQIGG
jgi:putative tryptophan/tyrosine transport system substrate-binding protein